MLAAVSAVAAAFVIAAGAAAANAPSSSYTLTGFALGSPQGTTAFLAGSATGSSGDRAFWRATVTSASLTSCATLGSVCSVTGGSVALTSNNGARLNGSVLNGTVSLTGQAASTCGQEQYTYDAAVTAADGTSWTLAAVVTERRFAFRGRCLALGASVQGSLTAGFSGMPG
jgi:hypothetical protein